MNLDLIEVILHDFKPTSEEHKKIKFYLETHKGDCEYYLSHNLKYKERIIALKSMYHSIKVDLLGDICRRVYS